MLMSYTTYDFNEPDICTSRLHIRNFFAFYSAAAIIYRYVKP